MLWLWIALVGLIALCAFFAATETALMMLNPYRLKHAAQTGSLRARYAQDLLKSPDRLIGVILLGQNICDIGVTMVATAITVQWFGNEEYVMAILAVVLAIVTLIFADAAPKTLAALNPERIGLPSVFVYRPLLKILWPIVWLTSIATRLLLRPFGVKVDDERSTSLSTEELRSVLAESSAFTKNTNANRHMMIAILDLEKTMVEDIMIPRREIKGIDITQPWSEVLHDLESIPHTRVPVWKDSVDDLQGVVHLRKLVSDLRSGSLDIERLRQKWVEPFYIYEGTSLPQMLAQFEKNKRRLAFIVDEYGDVQGLVTLQDVLHEIIWQVSGDVAGYRERIASKDADGSYLVRGNTSIRRLNRTMDWDLPSHLANTINGLICEKLEDFPRPNQTMTIENYEISIVSVENRQVKTAKIRVKTD